MPAATSLTTAKKNTLTVKARTEKLHKNKPEQPDVIAIFKQIKVLMKGYVKGSIIEQEGVPSMYNLVSEKAIEVEGRKKSEVHFAGVAIQKGYVSFYFMPVYMNTEADKIVKPNLMKCLKGKACFHINQDDAVIMEQIQSALDKGYELYEKRGWV